MKHIKYHSIPRIDNATRYLEQGEKIYVFEKIDGANASIVNNNGEVEIFSRNKHIGKPETFRGFRLWCDTQKNIKDIPVNIRLFGEWVVQHKIKYNKETENTFVLFDIFDEDKEEYYRIEDVISFAKKYEFKTPELLYSGEFVSMEHLEQFVGKTNIADGMPGEGIVIRAKDYISKWVIEGFQETKRVKSQKIDTDIEAINLFKQICTTARVEKIMHKGIDEGVYQNFKTENFKTLIPYVVKEVIVDIFKEEHEVISSIEDKVVFEKICRVEIAKLVKVIAKMGE